jgi:hypothetical protein
MKERKTDDDSFVSVFNCVLEQVRNLFSEMLPHTFKILNNNLPRVEKSASKSSPFMKLK